MKFPSAPDSVAKYSPKRRRNALLLTLMTMLFCGTSSAVSAAPSVQIQLKNGDKLSGELKHRTTTTVMIQTSYAGLLTINLDEVMAFTPVSQGNEASANTQAQSATVTAGAVPAQWSLQLDLSAATRSGKEHAKNYSLTERFSFRQGDWRSSLDAHYDYETKETARKTHKYTLNPGLDYFYSPQLFWRINGDFSYNYLSADYKNIDISTGPGYALWQQGATRLDLMLLVGHKQAYFRDDERFISLPGFRSPLGYNTASLAWDFSQQWAGSHLELFSEGSWLELLSQPLSFFDFERELKIDSGLRYRLTETIRVSWSWHYESTDLTLELPMMSPIPLHVSDSKQKISIGAAF